MAVRSDMPAPPLRSELGLNMLGKRSWRRNSAGAASEVLGNHKGVSNTTIIELANDEHYERHLPLIATGEIIGSLALTEPVAGSDAAAHRTSVTRVADGWLLNGGKIFVTNAAEVSVVKVMALAKSSGGIAISSPFWWIETPQAQCVSLCDCPNGAQ